MAHIPWHVAQHPVRHNYQCQDCHVQTRMAIVQCALQHINEHCPTSSEQCARNAQQCPMQLNTLLNLNIHLLLTMLNIWKIPDFFGIKFFVLFSQILIKILFWRFSGLTKPWKTPTIYLLEKRKKKLLSRVAWKYIEIINVKLVVGCWKSK